VCFAGAIAAACGASFQAAPDVELHYEESGQGTQAIVAIHGFSASLDTWDEVRLELEKTSHLYRIDLIGFGRSSKPKAFGYTLEEQAEVMASFVRSVVRPKFARVILMGHSYGGAVAMMTYSRIKGSADNPIAGLVLIDSLAFPEKLRFPIYISILKVPLVGRIALDVIPASWLVSWGLHKLYFDQRLVTRARVRQYSQYYQEPGFHRALLRTARQKMSGVNSAIGAVEVPTLILWGTHDTLIPSPIAVRIHAAIGMSQAPEMLECGHVPQEEAPGETARGIVKFID
jgi:pimeloyl-ACP methyl ester carboxylesterase